MSVDQLEQLKNKLDDLMSRHTTASKKKAKLQGQLEEKKQDLLRLVEEIKAAGYDPKKLKEERDKAAAELNTMMETFEKELAEVEKALESFEK